MPPGEFRNEDARNFSAIISVLPVSFDAYRGIVYTENRSREITDVPVGLARRNKIGGTEATLDASRGRERDPSGRSSRLEVRFKHLASFLGLLVSGQTFKSDRTLRATVRET